MILIPPSRHVLNSDSILQHLFVKSIDIPFTKNACVRFKTSSVLSLFKKKNLYIPSIMFRISAYFYISEQ